MFKNTPAYQIWPIFFFVLYITVNNSRMKKISKTINKVLEKKTIGEEVCQISRPRLSSFEKKIVKTNTERFNFMYNFVQKINATEYFVGILHQLRNLSQFTSRSAWDWTFRRDEESYFAKSLLQSIMFCSWKKQSWDSWCCCQQQNISAQHMKKSSVWLVLLNWLKCDFHVAAMKIWHNQRLHLQVFNLPAFPTKPFNKNVGRVVSACLIFFFALSILHCNWHLFTRKLTEKSPCMFYLDQLDVVQICTTAADSHLQPSCSVSQNNSVEISGFVSPSLCKKPKKPWSDNECKEKSRKQNTLHPPALAHMNRKSLTVGYRTAVNCTSLVLQKPSFWDKLEFNLDIPTFTNGKDIMDVRETRNRWKHPCSPSASHQTMKVFQCRKLCFIIGWWNHQPEVAASVLAAQSVVPPSAGSALQSLEAAPQLSDWGGAPVVAAGGGAPKLSAIAGTACTGSPHWERERERERERKREIKKQGKGGNQKQWFLQ